jgi:ATP-dependent DNA ligase
MLKSKTFSKLYGQSKDLRIKVWHIMVQEKDTHAEIITHHGLENGRHIETKREINGKNIGRSNETTAYEQALLEAKKRWIDKKEKEKYTENVADLDGNEDEYTDVPRPMLAKEFKDNKLKISYPCFTQPKLDGYRAVYFKGSLYSRQGKEFNKDITEHITRELKEQNIEWILDGELYIDNDNFGTLGVLRKKKPTTQDLKDKTMIKYNVYDIIDKNMVMSSRLRVLDELFTTRQLENTIQVQTRQVNTEQEIKECHAEYISKKYEGTIIRNINSKYEIKVRSSNLQKYKDFIDEEFEIIGAEEEQGGMVKWIVKTGNGREFRVSSTGTKSERIELYKNYKEYIGKKLWVKYFDYDAECGVPRFPKTMRPGKEAIRQTTL